MVKNQFNLIDEKWIPIADRGLVSLWDVFSDSTIIALGGDAVKKIALLKLLLAIAQSAWTPENEEEWKREGAKGLCEKVQVYLKKWYAAFYLYGEKPFLQIPAIEKADKKSFGTVLSTIAVGNTTLLNSSQIERALDNPERALMLIEQMSFSLGGKKTDNSIVLSPGYTGKMNEKGKPSTGKPGPGLAYMGLLHSFVYGSNVIETIWINLFSKEQINAMNIFPEGLGIAPWEQMPQGEDDDIAKALKNSYMGRLIPLSRFLLIKPDGMHYSEGILHKNYLEGVVDPSISVNNAAKKTTVLWADPEKRPWRQLPALLSFIQNRDGSFDCMQLRINMDRLKNFESFTLWSGGMRVSSNAGEQYLSGTNDFVESEIQLSGQIFVRAIFMETLNQEMEVMDKVSRNLYGRILGYFKEFKVDGKNIAANATSEYWQFCEELFQELVNLCETEPTQAKDLRKKYYQFAFSIYDLYCSNQSARQMEVWAKNRFGFDTIETKKEKEAKD